MASQGTWVLRGKIDIQKRFVTFWQYVCICVGVCEGVWLHSRLGAATAQQLQRLQLTLRIVVVLMIGAGGLAARHLHLHAAGHTCHRYANGLGGNGRLASAECIQQILWIIHAHGHLFGSKINFN